MVTFTANTKIVSADVNANFAGLADASLIPSNTINFTKMLKSAWTSFTPTWVGLTTLGNGTSTAWYQQIGSWVIYKGRLLAGSTTNTIGTGNPLYCDFPVTPLARAADPDHGSGLLTDSGGGNHVPIIAVVASATALNFYAGGTQAVAGGYPAGYFTTGAGNSTSDTLSWTIIYEAA